MTLSRREFVATAISGVGAVGILPGASAMAAEQPKAVPAAISPGAPTLVVRDLARVSAYYEESIGLEQVDKDSETARLGAAGKTLLVLRRRADADPEPAGLAGLYHTAFLLPSRASLGAWLRRAIRLRVPFSGMADHIVSESLYLADPEGNGIEVYADRARETWKWEGDTVKMSNLPLDGDGILRDGAALPERDHVAPGTVVGHVHLRVGAIPAAEAFYRDVIGFDVTWRRTGATFYASSRYHHHLATNTWESAGSPRRPGTTTGLAVLSLNVGDDAVFGAMAERMLAAGGKRQGDTVTADDPWGNLVVLAKS